MTVTSHHPPRGRSPGKGKGWSPPAKRPLGGLSPGWPRTGRAPKEEPLLALTDEPSPWVPRGPHGCDLHGRSADSDHGWGSPGPHVSG